MISTIVIIAPPPMPCIALNIMSYEEIRHFITRRYEWSLTWIIVLAKAHASEKIQKITREPKRTVFRPKISENRPYNGVKAKLKSIGISAKKVISSLPCEEICCGNPRTFFASLQIR